ncbi:MAG: sensor histidine kinase [Gemmataceae bacterium]
MTEIAPPKTEPAPPAGRRYAAALVAGLLIWTGLIGILAYLLYSRSYWLRESDEANLREWIDEGRVFRKTLPELVAEYLELRDRYQTPDDEALAVRKRQEIAEQLKRLADPTRIYAGQIPLFPDIYRLEISFPGTGWDAIVWNSPLPRPRSPVKAISKLHYDILGTANSRARLLCEYRLHAYNARQREAEEAQSRLLIAIGMAVGFGLPAFAWVYFALQRERSRELARLRAVQGAEHAANVALKETLARQDAERASEDLQRQLLERNLETARQESRASEAERAALELKSQLFASIGIMAGSYAHNIKNLLVRPNDLIARCLDSDGVPDKQHAMLGEVKETLSIVTDRLQQILHTVRRDPTRSEKTPVDLNSLLGELVTTWQELAREKWKLILTADLSPGEFVIPGDSSHLVQAFENLIFNARDATFEMRSRLRERAYADPNADPNARQQALLDAASWRGAATVRTRREGDALIVEVTDNGIGMTEEVRRRCTQTHFSTKRDNALFEGLTAGMGLGLSFVTMVLERHGATLEIESAPERGATFRITFPTFPTVGQDGDGRSAEQVQPNAVR